MLKVGRGPLEGVILSHFNLRGNQSPSTRAHGAPMAHATHLEVTNASLSWRKPTWVYVQGRRGVLSARGFLGMGGDLQ